MPRGFKDVIVLTAALASFIVGILAIWLSIVFYRSSLQSRHETRESAREVARKHDVERVAFRADLLEAFMAVRAKDPAAAAERLEAARAAFGGEEMNGRSIYPEKYEQFLVEALRVLLAQGQFGEAVRLGGRALHSAGASGRGRNLVEFLVLQAEAWNGLAARQ